MADVQTLEAVAAVVDDSTNPARIPRGMVKINGVACPAWIEFEIDSNTFHEADTFSVLLAISDLESPQDLAWMTSQSTISVEVLAGFPKNAENYGAADLTSWITGNVDQIEFDPCGRALTLSGRDLTSLLIDAKTTEKWQAQTASEIATTLANRHGLTPVVTATSTPVGRYYQIDHVSMTSTDTEWEFLTWLAVQEGFAVYVKGKELHFEPRANPDDANVVDIQWQEPDNEFGYFRSNTKRLSFSRTLTVGKGVVVQVRSWNQKQKKGFNATYPTSNAKGIRPGSASAPAQVYSYVIPNLTQEQALQRAQTLYNELIKHEMRFRADLPADDDLDSTWMAKVSGTGTDFDQKYFIESVNRSMSNGGGYTMSLRGKNHSDQTSPVP